MSVPLCRADSAVDADVVGRRQQRFQQKGVHVITSDTIEPGTVTAGPPDLPYLVGAMLPMAQGTVDDVEAPTIEGTPS